MLLCFILLLKNLCFSSMKTLLKRTAILIWTLLRSRHFFIKSLELSGLFFIPGIHRRSSCRIWASRSARRRGSIWTWTNIAPKQTWKFIEFWHFDYKNSYFFLFWCSKNIYWETFQQCCGSGFGSAHKSTVVLVRWIRIQEGKNDPQKDKNVRKYHVFVVLEVLFEDWRLLL